MLNLNGKLYTVPGVYGTVEVIVLGSITLPAFNNLLIIGGAKKGIPTSATGKKGYEVLKVFSSLADVKNFYGTGNLYNAADYAKRGGAGVIIFANIASLTQMSGTLQDNAGTPADTMDLAAADAFWGAAGNDISLTIATSSANTTFTIIPPKLTKFLTSNASTSSKIVSLDDVSGLYAGQTIRIWDNSAASPQSTSITAVDSTNKQITLADNPSAAFATSGYARVFVEDTDNQKTKTFDNTTATVQDIINWINQSAILTADRSTYTGAVPTTLSKTFFGVLSGATKGTSPSVTETTGGDFDTFASSAPKLFEEFTNNTQMRVRLLNVISNNSSVHAVYKTLATTLRAQQYSVQVITGSALGDILLASSNAGHPIARAKILNSSDVIFVGMGIDDQAAYLTSAPLVAGMMSANSVKRNLTWDNINATKLEYTFGEFNKETETVNYINNGVIIFGTGKNGFYLIQGINTYQNHDTEWNASDNTSYLIQQRQIVDYVYEGYKQQMEQGVGADDYGPVTATQQGLKVLEKYATDGYIKPGYKILNAYQSGNAVVTQPQITPAEGTDFVGFELKVVIPS